MTWKRLAHQEITSTGDNFSEFEFAEADILKVVMYVVKQGTGDLTLYPNAVTSGSNFSANYTKNGGSYAGNNNHCGIHGNYGQLAGNTLATYHINNLKTSEKLVQWNYCIDTGSASTNLPDRFEAVGKYTDTSNHITSFSATLGSGGFGAGSYITVWGDASDTVTDEKTTISNVEDGTRFYETDTRKIYRFTPSTLADSSESSLTDVVFDADTMTGSVTYSGNEITRTGSSSWVNGLNSNFFFRNSGTQTIECVAQKTGTSAWCLFGLASAKTVESSNMDDQMEYAIRSADDGRTWIRQSSGNWTQVSDTSDNVTFKIVNDRTTVTYYANGSSIGTTTHGTPASTYYLMTLCAQTNVDGSYKFDYSGDITTGDPSKWTERGSA